MNRPDPLTAWCEVGNEMLRIVGFMSPEQRDDFLPDWFLPQLLKLAAAGSALRASSETATGKRWTEVLCQKCGGNGVVKIPGGVSQCPRCDGRCYEPAPGPATEEP